MKAYIDGMIIDLPGLKSYSRGDGDRPAFHDDRSMAGWIVELAKRLKLVETINISMREELNALANALAKLKKRKESKAA